MIALPLKSVRRPISYSNKSPLTSNTTIVPNVTQAKYDEKAGTGTALAAPLDDALALATVGDTAPDSLVVPTCGDVAAAAAALPESETELPPFPKAPPVVLVLIALVLTLPTPLAVAKAAAVIGRSDLGSDVGGTAVVG